LGPWFRVGENGLGGAIHGQGGVSSFKLQASTLRKIAIAIAVLRFATEVYKDIIIARCTAIYL
jgi:hypothetical protein